VKVERSGETSILAIDVEMPALTDKPRVAMRA